MRQPPGFRDKTQPDYVCRLLRSIYGLKQSPRAWIHRLSDFLLTLGLKEGIAYQSLVVYIKGNIKAYFHIVLTFSSPTFINKVVESLKSEFSIKDLRRLAYFLGIQVTPIPGGLFLSQQQYAANLLHDENLANLKPSTTPMEAKLDLYSTAAKVLSHEEITRFRKIVGSPQYLAKTCPDIAYAMNKISQFLSQPATFHWQVLQSILRYVSQNPFLGIHIRRMESNKLEAFSDTDWARDAFNRQSRKYNQVFTLTIQIIRDW